MLQYTTISADAEAKTTSNDGHFHLAEASSMRSSKIASANAILSICPVDM